MTKEKELIKKMAETLAYVVVDAGLAMDDIWDRGNDGFSDQRDMAEEVLNQVKEYNEKLYDEALKAPRAFVAELEGDEEYL